MNTKKRESKTSEKKYIIKSPKTHNEIKNIAIKK